MQFDESIDYCRTGQAWWPDFGHSSKLGTRTNVWRWNPGSWNCKRLGGLIEDDERIPSVCLFGIKIQLKAWLRGTRTTPIRWVLLHDWWLQVLNSPHLFGISNVRTVCSKFSQSIPKPRTATNCSSFSAVWNHASTPKSKNIKKNLPCRFKVTLIPR